MDKKRCWACQQTLSLACFWRDKTRSDGRSARCKNCHSAHMETYWREVYYPRRRDALREANNTRNKARRAARRAAAPAD